MKIGKEASVAGLLVFGTTTSLFSKIVYELQSTGLDGEAKFFRKPWAMTTLMFAGMSMCLPLAYYSQYKEGKKKQQQAGANGDVVQPLLDVSQPQAAKRSELKEVLLLAIPTVFDLAATVLMNVGLLSVTASVYQMMRGAEMLFAALFTVVFLKRSLNRLHFLGMLFCVVGITLVGMSSMLSADSGSAHAPEDSSKVLLGMALIVASQCVQAAQITFEDFFMSDLDIAPMKIVGYEGLIGVILMSWVMLPVVYFLPGVEGDGLHENSLDTLKMVADSHVLQAVLAIDMFALLAYNLCGMSVTGHLGAVFRTVLETLRTLFVWLVDLALFYGLHRMLGEAWTPYSPIQAAGFVVLVAGTLVYGRGDEAAGAEESKRLLEGEGAADVEGAAGAGALVVTPDTAPIAAPSRPTTAPIGMRRGTPSRYGTSFRASMTITGGSYSAHSLPHSFQSRASVQGAGE